MFLFFFFFFFFCFVVVLSCFLLLAHLSRRHTRCAYSIAIIQRPFLLPSTISNISQTAWSISQILCGASLGRGNESLFADILLAHLSQRLICELIGYSWSGVRPSSSVVNNFKHLLLQNRLPDQSQILCGASLGRENESLFAASGSHDQDCRHAQIW